MKKLKLILSLLIVSILINGCAGKEPKIKYKKAPVYDFQIVSFKSSYIESEPKYITIDTKKVTRKEYRLTSAEVMQICRPLLQELNTIYKETKSFYDEQINDYKRINKESK